MAQRRYAFGEELKKKHGTYAVKCCLYHVLISSTISDYTLIDRYDFDGEDSIEAFVERLESNGAIR